MRELELFAGAGGGILGGVLLGWRTVCAVEIDPYCRWLLYARQRDGHLPTFPVWDYIQTFDGVPWRGRVDAVSGGFPCQDISSAGSRKGLAGSKSGLWREFARIIGEVRPRFVFIENSPHLRTRGLVRVLKDLAGLGFDAEWGVLGASDVGAPHQRRRMWILGHSHGEKRVVGVDAKMEGTSIPRRDGREWGVADADGIARRQRPNPRHSSTASCHKPPHWWPMAVIPRVDDGVAHRLDRCRAIGNGQVPSVAALAFTLLARRAGIALEGYPP